MERISLNRLKNKIDFLNHLTKNPKESYTLEDNELIRHSGNYHLCGAYGGWELDQMCKSGGTRSVFNTGHIPKRELYNLICAYVQGIIRTQDNEL